MEKINLGTIQLPINAATKTFAILAKRGAGKSYTAAVMAEEFAKANIPFVVFDPIDVWWGLRLAADAKRRGLPVVVFGVEHADILIDRDMGKRIAEAIVRENISCVISTFGMPKVAQRHLITEFAEELLKLNDTPRHIFIEEAHEFVPQRIMGGLAKCFAAVEALVVMGRNRGIGVTLINQRAATLNKDVLTQIDTLLAFRNVAPQDRKALKEWVEAHAAEGDFSSFMGSLPTLPTGEGWIWSPEFMGVFEKVRIRKRETFHPDREKLGDTFHVPPIEQGDIQAFISSFNAGKGTRTAVSAAPKATEEKRVEESETQAIIALKNEYESHLIAKDTEIRQLRQIIDQVQRTVGMPVTATPVASSYGVDQWVNKLGRNRAEGKILLFLAASAGLKFTRAQIALRTGLSSKSSTFESAIASLVRNHLIIREGNGEYRANPEL